MGVNAIGNWSVGPMSEQRTIPHCRPLMARLDTIPRVCRGFPDVFHPDWPGHFDRAIAGELATQRDNPWLIGWFCDNEMPWGGLDKGAIFRGTEPDAPVRREFVRFMAGRYGELAAFNRDFATACRDWEDIREFDGERIPTAGGGAAAMAAFAAHFAERYFSVVASTIRRHDPNHLYLGCRFVRNLPHPDIVAACGRHADVLSVNCYDLWPREGTFRTWHEAAGGLPIQLGELDRPSPPFVAALRTIARELPRWRRQPSLPSRPAW